MAITYANILPSPPKNGMPYATSVTVPTVEADLYNQSPAVPVGASPVPLIYHQAISADLVLVLVGATGPTFVVLQTDMGDGVYVDLAWIRTLATSGTLTYSLAAGVGGANGFQQTRALGTDPLASGSNQMPLGSRLRFTGQTVTANTVTATIRYKLLPLR